MEETQNGFNRRSTNATRTYPGTASRVSAAALETPLVRISGGVSSRSSRAGAGGGGGSGGGGSVPTVFVRPLSRSQLAPVHGGAGGHGSNNLNPPTSSLVTHELSSLRRSTPPSPAARPPISLDQPRPDSERHRNLYLGAPVSVNNSSISGGGSGGGGAAPGTIAAPTNALLSPNNSSSSFNYKCYLDSSITAAEQVRLPTNSRTSSNINIKKGRSDNVSQEDGGSVITMQPSSKRNFVEGAPIIGGDLLETGKVRLAESSITCPYCRKCRCAACATPRPLPSRWICSKSVHCGPEPFLDYVTCLCCVKAIFYHCGKDREPDGGLMCADKPCSCAPHRKFWRWGYMAAMSLVFPCLCLYWPCKGAIKLTEKAYQAYHSNGCRCTSSSNNHHHQTSSSLFGTSSSSSAAPPGPRGGDDGGAAGATATANNSSAAFPHNVDHSSEDEEGHIMNNSNSSSSNSNSHLHSHQHHRHHHHSHHHHHRGEPNAYAGSPVAPSSLRPGGGGTNKQQQLLESPASSPR
jgi:protein sprouty family protein 2